MKELVGLIESPAEDLAASAKGPADDCFVAPAAVGQNLLLSKSDAATEAALVVGGFRSGVRAIIDACVRTNETIWRYSEDPDSIDAFMAVLVEGNIISPNEARLGRASPKLTKLCRIGTHCELLTREEVFQYLEPGYTILYQVIVLYHTLQGDEDVRFQNLVQILREERTPSREALSNRTAAAKRAKRSSDSLPAPSDSARIEGNIGRTFGLVLLTPGQHDFPTLNEDYLNPPRFSQLAYDLLAEEATAVVVARLADLPLIENKLLPMIGFPGPSHVFLIREPGGSNVTDAEILVMADRRQTPSVPVFRWLSPDDSFDAVSVAELLVPDTKRKLHPFAQEPATAVGWLSLIGSTTRGQAHE
jgi:hypothetical protein